MKKSYLRKYFWKTVLLCFAIGFLVTGGTIIWAMSLPLPDLVSFESRKVIESTKIYDRTGNVFLFDINQNVKRTVVPYSAISDNLKNATIAIEDAGFWLHNGIEPKAIVRAVFANLTSGRAAQGGSTITQQVVKNALLTKDKKITRKIKEAILALRIEKVMTKQEILSIYLNESPYGGSLYGVEEASLAFFGKHASEVSIAEAAYLASLTKAPSYFSPYGQHRDELDSRKNLIITKMLEQEAISKEEAAGAKAENVQFVAQADKNIKAPHFVMYVRSLLEKELGVDEVETGGLRVTTTLNWDMQNAAEEIVTKMGAENVEKFGAKNAALVAIDPKTGEILSMVGSRDYFNAEIDGNVNVALAKRQPGSAFKPFSYATAFKKGFTPETTLLDVKTQFDLNCSADGKPIMNDNDEKGNCYIPKNYDDKYRGPISMRDALAQSINIPSIKTLYLAGLRDSLETARSMGIKGLEDANRYGLTLVLGGGEVSLLDLTSAYGTFATEGVRHDPIAILKVEDSSGKVLYAQEHTEAQVIDPEVTRQISSILSDNKARYNTYGANSPLYFYDRDVAVKTGTTNDYRDVWVVGYSPTLVAGIWSGNNDNTPMERKVAGLIAAPVWRAFMDKALPMVPDESFNSPEPADPAMRPMLRGSWQGEEGYEIDKVTGKLATEFTPAESRQWVPLNNIHTILYWVNRSDPRGARPTAPETDSQFLLWEYGVQEWLKEHPEYAAQATLIKPTAYDDVHRPEFAPKVAIVEPTPNKQVGLTEKVAVRVTASGKYPIKSVDILLNGELISQIIREPFGTFFFPAEKNANRGNNVITAIARDTMGNKGEAETPFTVR